MYSLLAVMVCAFVAGYSDNAIEHRFQEDSLPVRPSNRLRGLHLRPAFPAVLSLRPELSFHKGFPTHVAASIANLFATKPGCISRPRRIGGGPRPRLVLPADPRRRQRFAIGRDGLIYPVLKFGSKVDLRADVVKECETDQVPCFQFASFCDWAKPRSRNAFEAVVTEKNRDDLCDPYVLVAGEWTDSLFERATTAHSCGDDRLGEYHCTVING